MEIIVAIQCRDRRTDRRGTFGYRPLKEFYSVTPVFESIVDLIDYCCNHEIKMIYANN